MNRIVIFLFFMLSCFFVNAQTSTKNKSSNASPLQSMTSEQKASFIHDMVNQSREVIIPTIDEVKILEYYRANAIDERIYTKFKLLYKVLFNKEIDSYNKLMVCEFMLDNYSKDMVDLDWVKAYKLNVENTNKK